jgi:hypothetical protein
LITSLFKGVKYYKIDSTKIARRIKYPVAIVKCQLTICEVASSTVIAYKSALKRRLLDNSSLVEGIDLKSLTKFAHKTTLMEHKLNIMMFMHSLSHKSIIYSSYILLCDCVLCVTDLVWIAWYIKQHEIIETWIYISQVKIYPLKSVFRAENGTYIYCMGIL